MSQDPFTSFFGLILPGCVLLWMVTCALISHLSGWWQLAQSYRTESPFAGRLWRCQSAGLRWGTNYGGCINVGVNSEGLYLSAVFLFRIGHPPLLLPWCEISVRHVKAWFVFPLVEFRSRQAPDVPIRVQKGLAEKIRGDAGPAWPEC